MGWNILKTTNGGTSWNPQTSGTWFHLHSVYFINNDIGWAAGGLPTIAGLILKTTDGGSNWINQFDSNAALLSIYFIDNIKGWAVGSEYIGSGSQGVIFKTTNGGENWENQTIDTIFSLNSVYFTDQDTGWAVGSNGIILNTINGGVNWNPQTSGTIMFLQSIHFVNNNTGWAVGGNGTILKTTNGGVSFVEESKIDEIPTDNKLTQNYPNPFNPGIKIRYAIPQLSIVVIKVFDILGNGIETLVNEEKPVGAYEVTWYAESATGGLPSGVYFYQLKAGDFIDTKKMVLIK